MATTPVKTLDTGKGLIKVEIYTDPATKRIKVVPDKFEVSKKANEQVQWTCMQTHAHNAKGCFWAHFDQGSPFDRKEFKKHLELSGSPSDNAIVDKEYKYTIAIDGFPPLDPIGVVRA